MAIAQTNRRLSTRLLPSASSRKVVIKSPKLHSGQRHIFTKKRRFMILLCGRRFGKTTLITSKHIALQAAKEPLRIAIFAPIFKDITETWSQLIDLLEPVTKALDKSKHRLETHCGGIIEFWSLANMSKVEDSRGRKYDVVVYEETQKIDSEVLQKHWEGSLRATLVDTQGECWFLGTAPNSREHYFYRLLCYGSHDLTEDDFDIVFPEGVTPLDDYYSIRLPSHANPHLAPDELDKVKKEIPEMVFQQEFLARCVEYSGRMFCAVLSSMEAQKRIFGRATYDTGLETWLSFDFNKNPMACTLWQKDSLGFQIQCVAEFGAKDDSHVTIHYVTDQINAFFDEHGKPFDLKITGDATGRQTREVDRAYVSVYQTILDELGLNKRDLKVPKANPQHVDSHTQVNIYLDKHRSIIIDEVACKRLRADCLNAKSDMNKKIDKKAYDPHYLDTMRYFFWNALPHKLDKELYND